MTPSHDTFAFSDRLDCEWQRLRTTRRSITTARSWCVDDPRHPLARLTAEVDDLGDIVAATHRGVGQPGEGDEILLRLIELSRHDHLAGRLIIQRLLPGLAARSAHYWDFCERVDPVELVVPGAWLAIGGYDVEHRRRNVAPALISDAVFQTFRRPLRQRASSEIIRSAQTFADTSVGEPDMPALVELAEVITEARRAGVATHDIDLIRELVRVGSTSAVAAQHELTPRTIRNRRNRAVTHIRDAIGVGSAA